MLKIRSPDPSFGVASPELPETWVPRGPDPFDDVSPLDESISHLKQVTSNLPDNAPGLAMGLNNLSTKLERRYKREGKIEDLDDAIYNVERAIQIASLNHPHSPLALNHMSNLLECRYMRLGGGKDLEDAIRKVRDAIDMLKPGSSDLSTLSDSLGNKLERLYVSTGNIEALEEAIVQATKAVEHTRPDHPSLAEMQNNLEIKVQRRQQIEIDISAVPEAESTNNSKREILYTLGNLLAVRFGGARRIEDLDEAISKVEKAVEVADPNDPHMSEMLHTLSKRLNSRYDMIGKAADLEKAILMARRAATTKNIDHRNEALFQKELIDGLERRYLRAGAIEDLEAVISMGRKLVDASAGEEKAIALGSLSGSLVLRYERTGRTENLDEAVAKAREATNLISIRSTDWYRILGDLSSLIVRQYERTGRVEYLDEAMRTLKRTLGVDDDNDMERATSLSNLSILLDYRHRSPGRQDGDLREAISKARDAVRLAKEGHPQMAILKSNLSLRLESLYRNTGEIKTLNEAISRAEEAFMMTLKDDLVWAGRLHNLGRQLVLRYNQTHDLEDYEKAAKCFQDASQSRRGVPIWRINAALQGIQLLKEKDCHRANAIAQNAIQLLPSVCSRYLNRKDQQHAVSAAAGLTADACSLLLKCEEDAGRALQLSEFGRGLILGYIVDSRSDLSALKRDYPELAAEYEKNIAPIHAREAEQARELRETALELCLKKIRQKPAYARFLLEPTIEYLHSCSKDGPIVVINVTSVRSDAIIIYKSKIRSIWLREMDPLLTRNFPTRYWSKSGNDNYSWRGSNREYPRVMQQNKGVDERLLKCLAWLWRVCVEVVLNELSSYETTSDKHLRIWWIGGGLASSLPFHAAGDYDGQDNAFSQVVSSYTPSIKLLAYARSCVSRYEKRKPDRPSILVVTMPETQGMGSLWGVHEETSAIKNAARGGLLVKDLKQPTPQNVLDLIQESAILHFACHGSLDDVDPFNNSLVLHGGGEVSKLTVAQISDEVVRGQALMAFLSACSTAEMNAYSLADEAIHLVSGFQVAGFGHVIGSLWTVDDKACAEIAGFFYTGLMRTGKLELTGQLIAGALRDAIQRVRSAHPRKPSIWAPYIHSGA